MEGVVIQHPARLRLLETVEVPVLEQALRLGDTVPVEPARDTRLLRGKNENGIKAIKRYGFRGFHGFSPFRICEIREICGVFIFCCPDKKYESDSIHPVD